MEHDRVADSICAANCEKLDLPLVIPRQILGARSTADEILMKAESEAARILEAARVESSNTLNASYREGLLRGLSIFRHALDAAQVFRDHLEQTAESDLLSLAMSVIERLIGGNAELYKSVLQSMISESLSILRCDRGVTVYLSSIDMQSISPVFDEEQPTVLNQTSIRFQEADYLDNGTCILESIRGSIRCSVKTQIGAIEQAIREHVEVQTPKGDQA